MYHIQRVCVGRVVFVAAVVWATASVAAGQPNPAASLTSTTVPYTQNFDILRQNNGALSPNTITSLPRRVDIAPFTAAAEPNNLVGWRYRRGGSVETFQRNNGVATAPGGYSYGNEFNDNEAALGVLTGTNNVGTYFGVILRNQTGTTINAITVGYTGEQWRSGGRNDGTADRLDFRYVLNSNEIQGMGGTTAVPELNFSSPITTGSAGALNGNVAPNRTAISFDLTLNGSWEPGADLALEWFDFNVDGVDDGLAIDNVSIAVVTTPVPEPTGVLFAAGAVAAGGWVARRRRKATAAC